MRSKMNVFTIPEIEVALFGLYKCRDKHFTLHADADMYLIFTKKTNRHAYSISHVLSKSVD